MENKIKIFIKNEKGIKLTIDVLPTLSIGCFKANISKLILIPF